MRPGYVAAAFCGSSPLARPPSHSPSSCTPARDQRAHRRPVVAAPIWSTSPRLLVTSLPACNGRVHRLEGCLNARWSHPRPSPLTLPPSCPSSTLSLARLYCVLSSVSLSATATGGKLASSACASAPVGVYAPRARSQRLHRVSPFDHRQLTSPGLWRHITRTARHARLGSGCGWVVD
ncbi:hypothetical protein B0H14DRAFT_1164244 [Mycena olivaceomarginata]|nr:hypothetical protein B0H14DRAFT_1164244 [Mycena olivaceomarginata]